MTNTSPTTTEPPRDWPLLGKTVRIRRDRLGLTQEDISEAGGPSHQTLRRLEHGSPGPYRASTLNALEKTLGWDAGTISAILDGKPWRNPDDVVNEKLTAIGAAIRAAIPDLPGIDPAVTAALSEAAGEHLRSVKESVDAGLTTLGQPEHAKHPGINGHTVGVGSVELARQEAIRALLRFSTAVDENQGGLKSRRAVHRNVLSMIGKLMELPGDDA